MLRVKCVSYVLRLMCCYFQECADLEHSPAWYDLMVYLCMTPYLDIKDMKVNDEECRELHMNCVRQASSIIFHSKSLPFSKPLQPISRLMLDAER